jgi:hypothetical protein
MSRKALGIKGVRNAIPEISVAALRSRFAFDQFRGVLFPRRYCSTEGTLGSRKKALSVPLCMPNARGRNLEEARCLSEVQNETG